MIRGISILLAAAAAVFRFAGATGFSAPLSHYDVRAYGARGNGKTADTVAIQKAVDVCAADGGGRVVFPAGRYVSGPIFLKSRVRIEVESGAVIEGSTNFSEYPVIDGRWEGIERKVYASLFTGKNLHQVSITGRGCLQGRGENWWAANLKTLELRKQHGLTAREPENPLDAPLRWPRPRLINLYHCTNVLIRDLTLSNSPSWNIHPVYCENVTLDNLTIMAPPGSANTDAVDADSCRNVRISNCHFDVGDDCIVIKSGYNADGRRVGIPCENILVSNCTFAHGHGGVVIGSEMSGSVRNVSVMNCVFDGTQRGLRVKTSLGRGGVIENFRASNLIMRDIAEAAFSITAAYDRDAGQNRERPAPETIPVIRNIQWSDVTIATANQVADLSGLPESALQGVTLRHIQVTSARRGIRCSNAKGIVLEDIQFQIASGPAVEAQKVSGLELRRLVIARANEGEPVILFNGVSDALLSQCKVLEGSGVFLGFSGQSNGMIEMEGNRLPQGLKEREP
jgi:polygalacturonase